jgi:DNA-binding NarL/FixJ family response regulator
LLEPAAIQNVLNRVRSGNEDDQRLGVLTAQERKIFDLIGKGLTNRQIGDEIFLAEKTVKNYVSSVLMKLGMERRTEAAAYAARVDERSKRPR